MSNSSSAQAAPSTGDVGYTILDVDSPIFLRSAKGAEPRLTSPFSRKFDVAAWQAALAGASSERDFHLASAALLIGTMVGTLRDRFFAELLGPLTRQASIRLAVARANRATILSERKARAEAKGLGGEIAHLSAVAQTRFRPGAWSNELSFDDANTAIVDTLPHWFALARARGETHRGGRADYRLIGARAEYVLGIEKLFRDLWQEFQWEPWKLLRDGDAFVVDPVDPDLQAKWRAWDWREQDLVTQEVLMDHQARIRMGLEPEEANEPTVNAARWSKGGASLAVGRPSKKNAIMIAGRRQFIEKSYVGIFLDEPFPGSRLTARRLDSVWNVLLEACRHLLKIGDNTEIDRYSDVLRFSCSIRRATLVDAVSRSTGLDSVETEEAIDFLTSDSADLSTLFEKGVWHRPLVKVDESDELMIVAGALWHCSPIRRASLWLQQAGLGSRLSNTTQGLEFEEDVRGKVRASLESNRLLRHLPKAVTVLERRSEDEEQIDMIVRVGPDVLVCEIKCLLGPSEPLERHNYLDKVEGACRQASRKALWFEASEEAQVRALNAPLPRGTRISPVVILNQSAGCSLRYHGASVTDSTYLPLLLSTGRYVRGGVVNRPRQDGGLIRETLYESADEFSSKLPDLLQAPPPLARYERAIRWDYQSIDLPAGTLRLAVPVMDQEAHIKENIAFAQASDPRVARLMEEASREAP